MSVRQPTADLDSRRWIPFRNDSGEEIPPFAVLVLGAALADEPGVFSVTQPSAASMAAERLLFNGPLPCPEDGFGAGCQEMPADVACSDAAAAGDELGTEGGSWELHTGQTGFVCLGPVSDDLDDVVSVRLWGGGAGASSLTVQEQDGSPSYTSTTTLIVDQADGLQLSQPSAGQVRLDILAATTTQAGIVSTTTQTIGGNKTFANNVTVSGTFTVGVDDFHVNGSFITCSNQTHVYGGNSKITLPSIPHTPGDGRAVPLEWNTTTGAAFGALFSEADTTVATTGRRRVGFCNADGILLAYIETQLDAPLYKFIINGGTGSACFGFMDGNVGIDGGFQTEDSDVVVTGGLITAFEPGGAAAGTFTGTIGN